MRVDIDWHRCEGHGLCEEAAHSAFSIDDDGELHYAYEGRDVPEEEAAAVRSAIGACPVAALREEK